MPDYLHNQLPQPPTEHHDYEEIQANYQINSPQRPAPPRPAGVGSGGGRGTYGGTGTLGTYTESKIRGSEQPFDSSIKCS